MKTVSFTRMDNGTAEVYAFLDEHEKIFAYDLPARILERLEGMRNSLSGYKIDRLEHSLQTASRAERDGADADWIAAALVHDLGEDLAPIITILSQRPSSPHMFAKNALGRYAITVFFNINTMPTRSGSTRKSGRNIEITRIFMWLRNFAGIGIKPVLIQNISRSSWSILGPCLKTCFGAQPGMSALLKLRDLLP